METTKSVGWFPRIGPFKWKIGEMLGGSGNNDRLRHLARELLLPAKQPKCCKIVDGLWVPFLVVTREGTT